jgi:hypothetical protein
MVESAAPQVAGVIATYLSHAETSKQWDGLTGVKRVQEILKYLISDKSSWIQSGAKDPDGYDLRVVWNGAKEEDHKSSGANGYSDSQAPTKTKTLQVLLQNFIDPIGNVNAWVFYTADIGVSALCRNEKDAVGNFPAEDGAGLVDNPPWPGGSYKMKVEGMDCEYKNNGNDAGALWCNGRDAISCKEEEAKGKGEKGSKVCETGDTSRTQHPVVVCDW